MSLNPTVIVNELRFISSTLLEDISNFYPTIKETKQLDSKNLTILNILHILPYSIISLIFPFIIRYFMIGTSGEDSIDSFSNGFIRFYGALSFGLLFILLVQRK